MLPLGVFSVVEREETMPPISTYFVTLQLIGGRILQVIVLVTTCRVRAVCNQVSKNKNQITLASHKVHRQPNEPTYLTSNIIHEVTEKSARKVYE